MNYSKEYRHKRSQKKYAWKTRGIVGDIDKIFDIYWNTENCNQCGVKLEGNGTNKKCLDHCHKTGEFRKVLCHRCNKNVLSNKIYNTNKSGYHNLYYDTMGERGVYCKIFRAKKHLKVSKIKKNVLVAKFAYILFINWKLKRETKN